MFTDMVGSTAAAQTNEAGALELRDEQARLVRPLFVAHQGREIKSMGDGFLVEFDSALRAVQCAIDIQQHLHERNSQPGVAPIQLRIGIHLGDVEQRESDIFGDAVNIASRMETAAEAGGICLSGAVHEQIRNKLLDKLEKLPPTALKGLEAPMELYRVVLPWATRVPTSATKGPIRLAVLPFTNMSIDPADLYLADGLTEELITVLSQLVELRVIARTSVMPYKSTSKGVSQIGSELRVSAILEGSVRKAGNRLRVTAQLIDVESEGHVWAKSYDRELDDVFAVQSELAKQVAEALKVELRPAEEVRLDAKPTVRPDSYLLYLKGRSLLQSVWSEPAFRGAKEQFELALSIDDANARAHSGLADALMLLKWGHFLRPEDERGSEIRDHVMRALALDPNLAEAHSSLGDILWDSRAIREAEKEFQRALALNPSYSHARASYGHLLWELGRADEALREVKLAEELDPNSVQYVSWLVQLLIQMRRLDETAVKLEKLKELDREGFEYLGLLSYYHYARSELDRALQLTDRMDEIRPGESGLHRTWIYAAMGRREDAWKVIREQEKPAAKRPLTDLAMMHAVVGDLDGCFRYLSEAADQKDIPLQFWRIEPVLEPVRSDPRFKQLLKQLNLE
jgi:adenylate cyclase